VRSIKHKTAIKKVSEMASIDEQVLRAAKEIVVKFIEGGRVSPAGFSETFKDIYSTVEETVKGSKESKENPSQKSESDKKDK